MSRDSRSAGFRQTVYWPPERDEKLETIAQALHKEGVVGLYLSNGKINRSGIIEYLINAELDRMKLGIQSDGALRMPSR